VYGKKWGRRKADRPASAPPAPDSSAIANPITSTPSSFDAGESMVSATDAPPSPDSPLAQWRSNRIQVGLMVSDSERPNDAPASEDSVASTSPSYGESLASATAGPVQSEIDAPDRADGAPVGAGAATATTLFVPEKLVTKKFKKPENYSPYGKKWVSSSANDLKQREEESRKERERVMSPAGRALKTLKRLFSK
jgi:hypothetical protein